MLKGPDGLLEAELRTAAKPRAAGLLCHPHPLYGGNMHDAVLNAVGEALLSKQVSVMRFNLRGVGGSEGAYDDGEGEVLDLLAAARELRMRYPGLPLVLSGYSFGGGLALRAAEEAAPSAMILLAPATQNPFAPACPLLLICAEEDAWAPAKTLRAQLPERPGDSFCSLPTDHFFSGQLHEITNLVQNWLPEQFAWN